MDEIFGTDGRDSIDDSLRELMGEIPADAQLIARMSLAIATRIETLMKERRMNKRQLAEALGRRPSEISKWLSGHHNFTIATLMRLSLFFGKPVIEVATEVEGLTEKSNI